MLYYKVQTQGPSPVVVRLRSKLDIKMYRLKMKKKKKKGYIPPGASAKNIKQAGTNESQRIVRICNKRKI